MGLRVSEVRGRLGARYRRHGGGAASARTARDRLVHAAGVIGLALSVAAILVCWHHGSSGSTGSDGLARRDYGRDWIGARNRSTIFDSESEMLCGRDRRPQKLFRPTHPQLAESSDDEASRAKYRSSLQSQQVFRIVSHDWRSRVTAVLFALSCSRAMRTRLREP
jgi:hypothetical protein